MEFKGEAVKRTQKSTPFLASTADLGPSESGSGSASATTGKDRLLSISRLTKSARTAAGPASLTVNSCRQTSACCWESKQLPPFCYVCANLRLLSESLIEIYPRKGHEREFWGAWDSGLSTRLWAKTRETPQALWSGDRQAQPEVLACSTGSSSTTGYQRVAHTLESKSSVGSWRNFQERLVLLRSRLQWGHVTRVTTGCLQNHSRRIR